MIFIIIICSTSPVNDASSESSEGSGSSEGSSSEGEDEVQEPVIPVAEVKVEPESNLRWNLSEFLPGKSPNDAPLSHEPVEPIKSPHEPEDEDMNRTPSDHHYDNSNSSAPEKSDVEDSPMPPPKVKSPSHTPEDKTPDVDLSTALSFIKNFENLQPISSISDSDDNGGSERPPKIKRIKKERPRLPKEFGEADSSSDESSRFSESRRRSSIEEKKRVRKHSFPVNPYDTNSDTSTSKKAKKSPRKESQARKPSKSRRRPSISQKLIPSSDGSSDEAPSQPAPAPKVKEPKKTKRATTDDESDNVKHSSYRQSPPAQPTITSNSSDDGSESGGEVRDKKIEKNVSDRNKVEMMRKLFSAKGEGGKGGKGGAKGKGQVVVIMPEDAQNEPKSNDSENFEASVVVSIDLSRIDLSRLSIPPEKLKNTVIRTKSPAVAINERKSKKRKNHDESWRKPGYDHFSMSSSSSETMENLAANRTTHFTTNYNNDRLNNNIAKDFYHSPNSLDTKLPKIKKEHRTSPVKPSTNDFKNKIKQEAMKQEEFDGTNNSSLNYKEKKRKRIDGTGENSSSLPPTNHERVTVNGDATAKPEVVKKVYVSYFERTNDEIEQQEAR